MFTIAPPPDTSIDRHAESANFAAKPVNVSAPYLNDAYEQSLSSVFQLIASEQVSASTSSAIKSLVSIDMPKGMPSFTDIAQHLSRPGIKRFAFNFVDCCGLVCISSPFLAIGRNLSPGSLRCASGCNHCCSGPLRAVVVPVILFAR